MPIKQQDGTAVETGPGRAGRRRRRPRGRASIPFIVSADATAEDFSEQRRVCGVDNVDKMLAGWTGFWQNRTAADARQDSRAAVRLEAAVGDYRTTPSALLQVLADRRRAVALVSATGINHAGVDTEWSGTGFIVAPNLFLTNYHVLNTPAVAASATIEFNFEVSPESLLAGDARRPATQGFVLDPARLFLTSPVKGGLDYTFVWIEDAAAKARGIIPMSRDCFTASREEAAFIIHHPDGKVLQVSLDDTDVLRIETTVIHYTSDTMEGSSGAPVFDRRGRLIALHHASVDLVTELPDGGKTDVVNEGIKISAIAIDLDLRVQEGSEDTSYVQAVLREITGSDTMSGFYGAAGRHVESRQSRADAVIAGYDATDQDLDVGFWNIDGLATRFDRIEKLDAAAKIVTDLKLEIVGLSEMTRPALETLVERLEVIYGQQYTFAMSEPDVAKSRKSTAMIWLKTVLEGERIDWPEGIDAPLRRLTADSGKKAAMGKKELFFDRYPGLYRFKTLKPLLPYRFYAVPLYFKPMKRGQSRQIAARILALGIEDLTAAEPLDVILGGGMIAPLAAKDFRLTETTGISVFGAIDEREGSFSYVRSPKSPIESVFLPPSMRRAVKSPDFFVISRDRVMPNYRDISSHDPIAVRLSFPFDETGQVVDAAALDAMVDALLDPKRRRGRAEATRKVSRAELDPAGPTRAGNAQTDTAESGTTENGMEGKATRKIASKKTAAQKTAARKAGAEKEGSA